MNPALLCDECAYLQTERAGMLIDSHTPEHEAVEQAQEERCAEHGGGVQDERVSKELKGEVRGAPGKESL